MADSAILVETTILVDYLRRSDVAADYLDDARAQSELICSAVTEAELIIGADARGDLGAISQLLARFRMDLIRAHGLRSRSRLAQEVLSLPPGRVPRLPPRRGGGSTACPGCHAECETFPSLAGSQGDPAVLSLSSEPASPPSV
jgi:hypothetical protein